jgi:hypothetical protein
VGPGVGDAVKPLAVLLQLKLGFARAAQEIKDIHIYSQACVMLNIMSKDGRFGRFIPCRREKPA